VDTQRLATFLAVADTGSISAAAERLGYAQSSVSEQVRRLERELAATLFDRRHHGVALTPAGSRLVEHARLIVADVQRARTAVTGAAQVLRVGALDTLAGEWLPDVLGLHRERSADPHPVHVTTHHRAGLLAALRARRLDVAFLYQVQPPPTDPAGEHPLHHLVVDHDDLLIVGAPSLLAALGAGPGGADVPAAPWLISEPGCGYRALFEHHVRGRHLDVTVAAETVGLGVLRRLAARGEGIALLPRLAADPELRQGELAVIPHRLPLPRASITAVWRGTEPPPHARALIRRASDKGARAHPA
jgi:molybdate transport repressor ModE-like protein